MALFHRASLKPTKEEIIAGWAPGQPWGPAAGEPIDVIGSYRFDDPEGRVGIETFLFAAGGELFQTPFTYRDAPLVGAEAALITEMSHSVLGNRWVYDGWRDPLLVTVLAGVAMTGQGEALGMAVNDGRWYIAPATVRVHGGGWVKGRVPVDRFEMASDDAGGPVLRNDRFTLTLFRRPRTGPPRAMSLTATWPGQDEPVILAVVEER